MNILFACSEIYPLIKTGGLADVAYNLPRALQAMGHNVRIVLPAYRAVLARVGDAEPVATLNSIYGTTVRVRQTVLPDSGSEKDSLTVYLTDAPALFDRPGNPYGDSTRRDWDDNALRFGLFGRVVADIALNRAQLGWQPHIVHCNDWHTGLAPLWLAVEAERPATVFTIHNLAYQGLFPFAEFDRLQLPVTVNGIAVRDFRGLEFYRQLSFIKGGIVFADAVNTVSPGYAREVLHDDFGCGLDGLLRYRGAAFSGIVNGIDTEVWDPGSDPFIHRRYSSSSLQRKLANKTALRQEFQLPVNSERLLLGMVSRFSEQKGVDILLAALPRLLKLPVELMVLGSGGEKFERGLHAFAQRYPDRIAVVSGYDEALAHRVIAGADVLLIPSRYEPCGLTQMYSQRYGTLPLARAVGGLADTVIDINAGSAATGVLFADYSAEALVAAVRRALVLYRDPERWRHAQRKGMATDFSWRRSAREYRALYESLLSRHEHFPKQPAIKSADNKRIA